MHGVMHCVVCCGVMCDVYLISALNKFSRAFKLLQQI